MTRTKKISLSALVIAVAAVVVAGALLWGTTRPGKPLSPEPRVNPLATSEELATAASRRVFFGHQSVGKNVLSGVPAAFEQAKMPAPKIVDLGAASSLPAGTGEPVLAHAFIGRNGDPLGKIKDFDARLRAGLGRQVQVAAMKLCYLDITGSTDVTAVFEQYRQTMAALARDFPNVTFIHITTPVRTEPTDLKWRVKELIGRPNDNAARERYNSLMRSEYGDDLLFDLAAIEATGTDGVLTTVTHAGQQHLALAPGLAYDPGHLNAKGSVIAAKHFLALVGRAGPAA